MLQSKYGCRDENGDLLIVDGGFQGGAHGYLRLTKAYVTTN